MVIVPKPANLAGFYTIRFKELYDLTKKCILYSKHNLLNKCNKVAYESKLEYKHYFKVTKSIPL